jgi:hypothetical protein
VTLRNPKNATFEPGRAIAFARGEACSFSLESNERSDALYDAAHRDMDGGKTDAKIKLNAILGCSHAVDTAGGNEMNGLALCSARHRRRQFAGEFLRCLADDKLFFILIGLTVQAAALLAFLFHRAYLEEVIKQYIFVWTLAGVIGLSLLFAIQYLLLSIRERPARPLMFAADIIASFFCPDRLAGFVRYYSLALFMGAFTTIKTMLPLMHHFWADPWLSSVDRFLHFGHDPWRIIRPWFGHRQVTQIIEFIYSPIWLSCLLIFVLYFCFTTADLQHRRRVLLSFILVWIINGAVLAGLFMSGGPVYYGAITHDYARYAGLVRYLSFDHALPFSATAEQNMLWQLHVSGAPNVGAGISAFPSLHVSMILLCCLAAWRVNRWCLYALIGLSAVIVSGAVHLGWHYAVGTYVDFLLVPIIWRLGEIACTSSPRTSSRDVSHEERPLPEAGYAL